MAELDKILKGVVNVGVGAVASVVEIGSNLTRTLAEKGETTLSNNKDKVEQLKAKMAEMQDGVSRIARESARLTREQRDALRQIFDQLDAMDEAEAAEAAAEVEEIEEVPEDFEDTVEEDGIASEPFEIPVKNAEADDESNG